MAKAYIAPDNYLNELLDELKRGSVKVSQVRENLVICEDHQFDCHWQQNIWQNPEIITITSISDAQKKLKERAPLWALYSTESHRRAQLIQEKIGPTKSKLYTFPCVVPRGAIGSWTLLDENTILASSQCSSSLPNGKIEFIEDHENPPSRAYLKLWDVFTTQGFAPKKNEITLDMGACPGGWSWVLQRLGCQVISVDKAPVDPSLQKLVKYIKQDAFTLKPESIGHVDWFFSDIICYPAKLYELVLKWKNTGLVRNFVCTIKFKGQTDFETVEAFSKIPGSRIVHLNYNKHELTWICLEENV